MVIPDQLQVYRLKILVVIYLRGEEYVRAYQRQNSVQVFSELRFLCWRLSLMGKSLTGKIFWWSNTLLIQGAILVNRLIF
jgi:hypothetical protein